VTQTESERARRVARRMACIAGTAGPQVGQEASEESASGGNMKDHRGRG
jgi:hypothetical protein